MKERPILFSGPMVNAILDGRKTQTRRILRKQPIDIMPMKVPDEWVTLQTRNPNRGRVVVCRYGVPGDRLWVRENLRHHPTGSPTRYAADGCPVMRDGESADWVFNERHVPSIHMPRWASRITLEITGVRVARVQDISEADARAEGCGGYVGGEGPVPESALAVEPGYLHPNFYREGFAYVWDSINAKRGFGWDANPFVWVLTFKKV